MPTAGGDDAASVASSEHPEEEEAEVMAGEEDTGDDFSFEWAALGDAVPGPLEEDDKVDVEAAAAARAEELESLAAIFGDAFAVTPRGCRLELTPFSLDEEGASTAASRRLVPAVLDVVLPASYPHRGFAAVAECSAGGVFVRGAAAAINRDLSAVALECAAAGEPCVFRMSQVVDAAMSSCSRASVAAGAGGVPAPVHELVDTALDLPATFIGPLAEVLKKFPGTLGVTHIENVLRRDLAESFEAERQRLLDLRGKIVEQKLTFHGTSRRNVFGIVRDGLLVPGKESGVSVATGSRFGVGIYTTPDPLLAAMYANGSGRIVVCATLVGKVVTMLHDVFGRRRATKGFDTHVSADGKQLVAFRKQQVLPVLVIHFHTKRLSHEVYHEVSSGGCHMMVRGERNPHSELLEVKRKARAKNAAFFLGPGRKVLGMCPHDDDDDDETAFRFQDSRFAAGEGDGVGLSGGGFYQGCRVDERDFEEVRRQRWRERRLAAGLRL